MTEEKDTVVPETEIPAEHSAEPEETMEMPAENREDAAGSEKGKKDKKADVKKMKAELEELKKALEAEQQKAAEANDKYLRVCAEYDNFRTRTQKEKETAYGEAVADTVKGLLPVIDNLQYASKYGNADPEKFAEGVKLILDKLPETLEKMHIRPVGAPGETFDPTYHNAVMHEDNEEYGENEIMDVLQSGYLYEDRVIRYAMVKVAN
ncbi:MAG: nucleotide exchange factor GrpE [Clostridia bacterium]|nr:nucleotide exchange factor GrpE [Clostridia bacterium]